MIALNVRLGQTGNNVHDNYRLKNGIDAVAHITIYGTECNVFNVVMHWNIGTYQK